MNDDERSGKAFKEWQQSDEVTALSERLLKAGIYDHPGVTTVSEAIRAAYLAGWKERDELVNPVEDVEIDFGEGDDD